MIPQGDELPGVWEPGRELCKQGQLLELMGRLVEASVKCRSYAGDK